MLDGSDETLVVSKPHDPWGGIPTRDLRIFQRRSGLTELPKDHAAVARAGFEPAIFGL